MLSMQQNDVITSVLASLHSSLSGEINSKVLHAGEKKFHVGEMTVEVGSFSGHPGCYLRNIRVFPYNRDDTITSFLLSMLLASPVGR